MKVLGWIMVALGLVGLATEVQDLIDNTSEGPIVGLALSVIFIAGGVAIVRSRGRRPSPGPALGTGRSHDPATLEPAIFRLASERAGRVTPVEVAAALAVPFDAAQNGLESLCERGACQVLVTEAGVTVYRFAEFEAGGKRDLLEPARKV